MIEPYMVPQISLLSERQSALHANERLLIRMYQPMPFQLILYPKAPSAHITRIRFFPRMPRNMYHQWRFRPETLTAVAALERKRVRMRSIVHEERGFLFKRFSTQITNVRTFIGVNPAVFDNVASCCEHSPAEVAFEVFDALVSFFQMAHQPLGDAELFSA